MYDAARFAYISLDRHQKGTQHVAHLQKEIPMSIEVIPFCYVYHLKALSKYF